MDCQQVGDPFSSRQACGDVRDLPEPPWELAAGLEAACSRRSSALVSGSPGQGCCLLTSQPGEGGGMKLHELTQHHSSVQADALRIIARTHPQMLRGAFARC